MNSKKYYNEISTILDRLNTGIIFVVFIITTIVTILVSSIIAYKVTNQYPILVFPVVLICLYSIGYIILENQKPN